MRTDYNPFHGVSQFCDKMVTFKSFVLDGGKDVLGEWYAAHPFEKKRWRNLWARYYNLHMHLAAQPLGGWRDPYFHKLKGYEGLGRIEINYRNIAFRHIGFFGPGGDEFTILLAAEEVDWVYQPKGCIDVSFQRMKDVK